MPKAEQAPSHLVREVVGAVCMALFCILTDKLWFDIIGVAAYGFYTAHLAVIGSIRIILTV